MGHSALEIAAEIKAALPIEEIRAHVDETAVKVADYARSIAPVFDASDPDEHRDVPPGGGGPGGFRDSIVAEHAPDHDRMPAARVISRSRIAHLLEYGTKNMGETATFGKTAQAFGGTVTDTSDTTTQPGTPL